MKCLTVCVCRRTNSSSIISKLKQIYSNDLCLSFVLSQKISFLLSSNFYYETLRSECMYISTIWICGIACRMRRRWSEKLPLFISRAKKILSTPSDENKFWALISKVKLENEGIKFLELKKIQFTKRISLNIRIPQHRLKISYVHCTKGMKNLQTLNMFKFNDLKAIIQIRIFFLLYSVAVAAEFFF